jgi:hypothetical protein
MSTTQHTTNQPSAPTPEEIAAFLAETCQDLIDKQAEILAGVERFKAQYPTIPNAEIQGKAGDFAGAKGAMAAFTKRADGRRTEHKQPYDAAAAAVQVFFKKLTDPVAAARFDIQAAMVVFTERLERESRERARQEALRAAELAKLAEQQALTSGTPEALDTAVDLAKRAEHLEEHATGHHGAHTTVVGSHTQTSMHKRWSFNEAESDLMALVRAVAAGTAPLRYLAFNTVNIGQDVRSNGLRELPGCTIEEVKSVR